MDEKAMPNFMFKSPRGTGYVFRRGVPADVRDVIGKREFKVALGGDYRSASQRCRELAVETDKQIASARDAETVSQSPASVPVAQVKPVPHAPPLTPIRDVTQGFIASLHATVVDQVLSADKAQRYRSFVAVNPDEKLREIERLKSWAMAAKYGDDAAAQGWAEMLRGTLQRKGYCLPQELLQTAQERQLLVEYAAAYWDALDVLEAEYSGRPAVAMQSATPLLSAGLEHAKAVETMTLGGAVKEFLQTLAPDKRAMNKKHGFVLPAFLEVVGDIPVTDLRQSHVNDFLRTMQKLPPLWSDLRRKHGHAIKELASRDWEHTIALSTYEGTHVASLRSFLERAKRDWQDVGFPTTLSARVPYVGGRTKKVQKQRAVRPDEIHQIFFSEAMGKIVNSPTKAHKFWLLAVELYTGARVREICQLNPQHDWGSKDGIWWLRFTEDDGELLASDVTKSVKTHRSRTIPIHAELVRIGLPEYLDRLKLAGARRLFPQWPSTGGDAGAAPSKWVANYLRAIGLHGVANEKGDALRGSHAFRHTLLTYGRKNQVNLRCISGHSDASDNAVADGYEDETVLLPLSVKAERLAKLDYGIALPRPVPVLIPAVAKQSRTKAVHQSSKLGKSGSKQGPAS